MVNKFVRIFILISFTFTSLTGLYSCVSDEGGEIEIPPKEDFLVNQEDHIGGSIKAQDVVENISSPIEMAALIQNHGVPFSLKYLAPTQNVANYTTNFEKALALGVFGADLGYLNIYEKTGSIISYISAIRDLSEALNIGNFFDFQSIKNLATNNGDLDSLMYLSVKSFNNMDDYLRKNDKGNISSLIVAGIWIEGLYLATQVVKEKHNVAIAERIGEQKSTLDQLLILLKAYKDDPYFAALIKDFEELKDAYKDVQIEYQLGDPETIDKDGMLIIIQKSISIVTISEEQLENIINIVEKKRNKLISL